MRKKPFAPDDSRLSAGLRGYLYLTAAITGAAIMIVEILGAKMLAPFVGTSHFVWTAQIAITMVALAAGYYAGGWLVDRAPRLGRLYAGILVAALYLCLTVWIVEPVAFWCLNFKLALGSLLASAFLFFIPLALLAMVGPFFTRMLTVSISGVGGNVGRLAALSTLGSFLGTVLIGYVLIPFLPNSLTMCLTAALLMLVSVGYGVVWGRGPRHSVPLVLVALLGLGTGLGGVEAERRQQTPGMVELFRGNSNFGQLRVIENASGTVRFYWNDYLTQNTYDPQTRQSTSMFTYMLHGLARAYTEKIETALCIGLGVGIVPRELLRDGAQVEAVEINPAVVPVARQFFDCPTDRLQIVLGDGRQFLNACRRQYDAVILDAFLGDSSPSHLMTREAFTAVRRLLKPDGVLVMNTFGDFTPGRDFFTASLDRTLRAVFRSVRIHHAGSGNVLYVASDQPELTIRRPPDFTAVHPVCRGAVEDAFRGLGRVHPESGQVLTDDFNPVDFHDAANREELRRYLAGRGGHQSW